MLLVHFFDVHYTTTMWSLPPNFTFYGGRGHTKMNFPSSFWTWIKSLRIRLQEKQPHSQGSLLPPRPMGVVRVGETPGNEVAGKVACLWHINPLSPDIHIQILQTDLHTLPLRISWENLIKPSRHFLFCDHFLYSYNLISWQCMDIVRRKLLLVTIGT